MLVVARSTLSLVRSEYLCYPMLCKIMGLGLCEQIFGELRYTLYPTINPLLLYIFSITLNIAIKQICWLVLHILDMILQETFSQRGITRTGNKSRDYMFFQTSRVVVNLVGRLRLLMSIYISYEFSGIVYAEEIQVFIY